PAVRGNEFLAARSNRHAAAQAAAAEVKAKAAEGYRVVLAAPSSQGLTLMLRALEGEGAPPAGLERDVARALEAGDGVVGVVAPFTAGWCSPQDKLLLITEGDV